MVRYGRTPRPSLVYCDTRACRANSRFQVRRIGDLRQAVYGGVHSTDGIENFRVKVAALSIELGLVGKLVGLVAL
ncbi:hypothetical protein NEUTE1DRAFT_99811 [Neurospora tetrasperma FGSC 2508]|uniref:Uncharacterized protein n=1 Tax=Neurospora tetrasperma (strain FGSC 2508 / ATCC MYA-4615 / P0657) TaxID=510951 RepID=F8MHP1_NEUT8|nr:uncharacterized protein NEUTE1DRAFT_99811 [Neurospora tetrasperma FGSC 2508]EGO59652.1 hypothetical protein NEUTE1DRAFT_99811 [Neurospora tetrasperma FGSC 2508]EGZ73787.1 hypothetical protein NEUTE2DRAFT_128131 [Neurospora tetrasperma FGSC 2509]